MKNFIASFYNENDKDFNDSILSRQAFSSKGNIRNINFKTNDYNADWHIIGTWTRDIGNLEGKKIIYLQQEPPEIKLPSKEILDSCTMAITFFRIEHKIFQVLTPAALQWTYDVSAKIIAGKGHVYNKVNNNYLTDMLFAEIPKKQKKCSIILSKKNGIPGQRKRLFFLDALKSSFKNEIDIFGFGHNEISNKKDAIDPYYYSIALENVKMTNWWTEKLADVFLGFTCPIYYGCNNINDFFGKDALVKIDINKLEESLEIIDRTINQTNLINIEEIIKARRSILLDFNMLSIISLAINNYEKSSEKS